MYIYISLSLLPLVSVPGNLESMIIRELLLPRRLSFIYTERVERYILYIFLQLLYIYIYIVVCASSSLRVFIFPGMIVRAELRGCIFYMNGNEASIVGYCLNRRFTCVTADRSCFFVQRQKERERELWKDFQRLAYIFVLYCRAKQLFYSVGKFILGDFEIQRQFDLLRQTRIDEF